jgi:hypothetical protein
MHKKAGKKRTTKEANPNKRRASERETGTGVTRRPDVIYEISFSTLNEVDTNVLGGQTHEHTHTHTHKHSQFNNRTQPPALPFFFFLTMCTPSTERNKQKKKTSKNKTNEKDKIKCYRIRTHQK